MVGLVFKEIIYNFLLFKSLLELNLVDNPVQMLEIQYRMLSQICHFPSQHFYRGKLLTAR